MIVISWGAHRLLNALSSSIFLNSSKRTVQTKFKFLLNLIRGEFSEFTSLY